MIDFVAIRHRLAHDLPISPEEGRALWNRAAALAAQDTGSDLVPIPEPRKRCGVCNGTGRQKIPLLSDEITCMTCKGIGYELPCTMTAGAYQLVLAGQTHP